MTYAATERAPLSLSAANVDYAALLLRVTMGIGFIARSSVIQETKAGSLAAVSISDAAIRREYAAVPEDVWRPRRPAVLGSFLIRQCPHTPSLAPPLCAWCCECDAAVPPLLS